MPLNRTTAYIGLGGNVGDVMSSMRKALTLLDAHPEIAVLAVSSIYKTPPWGVEDQADFLNSCAEVSTSLTAQGLLEQCLETEQMLKRKRLQRWGPRTLDLDILLFGDEKVDQEGLTIPHPRMLERAFVLQPMCDLAPMLSISGKPLQEWNDALDHQGISVVNKSRNWW